jgi:hypothetical protein
MAHLVINPSGDIVNVEGFTRIRGCDISVKEELIEHIAEFFPQISTVTSFDGLD